MTTTEQIPSEDAPAEVQRLRAGAVGLVGVIFMAVATAAPITAMAGNVPVIVGSGIGINAPAGFVVATVILTVFTVGYVQMAKHITAAGAFYGYVSHGLGQLTGMVAGLLASFAYIVFEASIVGVFAYFAKGTVHDLVGVDLHWMWFAAFAMIASAVLSYFDVNLTAKILGVFLVTEVLVLALMAVAVLVRGGGHDGLMLSTLSPDRAFKISGLAAGGSVGLGLFMCFWSWIGFETTAMYGEESREPKRIIPKATLLTVVGIGVFYTFVTWATVAGNGRTQAVKIAGGSNPLDLFFGITKSFVGNWAADAFKILMVTGSFACALAFHNCASRYVYAIAREGVIPGTGALGRTHPRHGSPHIASFVQTGVTVAIVLAFWGAGKDPYVHLYTELAVLGTMALLIVQVLCSFSVIGYFHLQKRHPETAHWWKTFVAPLLGGLAMLYIVILLFQNQKAAAGAASTELFFKLIPYMVLAVAVLGAGVAGYLKVRRPEKYALVGRIVLEDTVER